MTDDAVGATRPRTRVELWAALILGASLLLWMFSLPAWPSLDSPVHLYYAQVLGELLRHSAHPPAAAYTIKHYLPPYALYYYTLLGLQVFVSSLLADKLIVCLYLVLFLGGIHRLARVLASGSENAADRALLLATVFALNWPLGMGFLNYCLSVALSMWALATWFGRADAPGFGWSVRMVGLTLLLTLAHPVPLLVVLGMAVADLLRRSWQGSRPTRRELWTLGVAALSLGYVVAFTEKHPLEQRTRAVEGPARRAMHEMLGFATGKDVGMVFGHSAAVLLYRAALPLVLAVALGLSMQFAWRRRRWEAADLFLLGAGSLLVVLPWLPTDISGAYFFPERLKLLVWAFAVVSMARPGGRGRWPWLWVGGSAVAVAALLIALNTALRPAARQARALQDVGRMHPGDRVLVLESPVLPGAAAVTPSWNPYTWIAVHGVRQGEAVLVNAPWLDSAILPLERAVSMPRVQVTPQVMNSPKALQSALETRPELRREVLPAVNVVVFTRAELLPAPPGWMGQGWQCASAQGELICRNGW